MTRDTYDDNTTTVMTLDLVNDDQQNSAVVWRIDRLVLGVFLETPPGTTAIFKSSNGTTTANDTFDFFNTQRVKAYVPQDDVYLRSTEHLTVRWQDLPNTGGFFVQLIAYYTSGYFAEGSFVGAGVF